MKSPGEIVGKTDFDMPWTREEAEWYRKIDQEVMRSGEAQADIEESLQSAEPELVEAAEHVAGTKDADPVRKREAIEAAVALYETLAQLRPEAGYTTKADAWRARLNGQKAERKPEHAGP